jgi:hypothetical protein
VQWPARPGWGLQGGGTWWLSRSLWGNHRLAKGEAPTDVATLAACAAEAFASCTAACSVDSEVKKFLEAGSFWQ